MSARDFLYWVRDHKSSAAGLVLVVAGCLALVALARRVHHLQPRARPVAAAASAASDAPSSAGAAAALTPAHTQDTEQDARTARMRGEFENAADYLAFVEQAIGRPQEGGKFYALLAWKRCSALAGHADRASLIAGDDAFHDTAAAFIADLGKRCTGVLDTYPAVQSLYDLALRQRGGKDFLVPENGRGIVAPAARDSADADIDAALRTGDRWAAAEALENNADFVDVGNSTGDDGVNRQLHEWSAQIVACELVGNCRGGMQAALHCVVTGDCVHADYRDVVRSQVPDTHRAVFDTMVQGMRQRMGLAPGQPTTDAS